MRDLQNDLEICEKVTKGPVKWQKFGKEYYLTGQYGLRPIILGTVPIDIGTEYSPVSISNLVDGLLKPVMPDHPDSFFIQEAWQGWPESINRAIAAEAAKSELVEQIGHLECTVKRQEGGLENLQSEYNELDRKNDQLEAEVERLRKEKERLMIVLNTINDIVSDSDGVAGYHLNGDIASWDSFGFMDAMQDALK